MNMNRQHVTLLVILNLSAAFDTVGHHIMLERPKSSFGIQDQVQKWFISYLSNRSQILESHLPDAHAFADDNQLYVSFQPDSMSGQLSAVTVMENCIDDIKTWMLNDKLKLNDASSEAKDLGFWLASQMKCDTNVNSSSYFILMIESLHQISPCYDFLGVDWGLLA
ncbi:Hypothetical predicted protein [Paramuricea clavata]|uniref:Uncharacterized protein n=1 Tax=Paramuricea clavata TaxID=317549 RepID=A0A7D9DKH7_PARCT|nr:Hypothetical predicted protein [Paramuricea clavata]